MNSTVRSQPEGPFMPTPPPATEQPDLPASLTPFIGRTPELAQLANLLADPAHRLITILAPGGMGKTRLALAAAQQHAPAESRGQVTVVVASGLETADLLPAIAQAVGCPLKPGHDPGRLLASHLNSVEHLLVLDAFETLLDAAPLLADLLAAAPGLTALVTSRARLNLPGESVLPLAGLPYPADPTDPDAGDYAAVQLCRDRMQRTTGQTVAATPAVVDICQAVGGMPLALELAAAWAGLLTPDEIAHELSRGLALLDRDTPAGTSVRAAFETTWQQLDATTQTAFMKLAVFESGFTREAAAAIAGADLDVLRTLQDRALLGRDPVSGRYRLHDLLRQYAAELLAASGQTVTLRTAHSTYYLHALRGQESAIKGRGTRSPRTPAPQALASPLTARELEVLHLIHAGLTNQAIADVLVVGLSTVKKHINRMYHKLDATSRTHALARARELGLLE
jgi:predicted ATPase